MNRAGELELIKANVGVKINLDTLIQPKISHNTQVV